MSKWTTLSADYSVMSGGKKSQRGIGSLGIYEGPKAAPSGKNPKIEASESGIVISWEDAKGRRNSRRLPAGTHVEWEDGVFRISIGFRGEPAKSSPGGWA